MRSWRDISEQISLRLEEDGISLDTLVRAVLIAPSDMEVEIVVEEDHEPITLVITGR